MIFVALDWPYDFIILMQAITDFIKQHQKLIFGVTGSLLAGYLILRDTIWKHTKQPHKKNLLEGSRHAQIKKIIVTTCPTSKGFFRKKLINFIKAHLSESGVKVLINCSPQKLLKAGCKCFLESMEGDDSDLIEYYHNALKTQLLIEDTISNIELISSDGRSKPIVIICDNNPMDIRHINQTDAIWTAFTNKYQVNQQEIIEGYDMVLHIIEQDSNPQQDERINAIWSQLREYHRIELKQDKDHQNFNRILQKIGKFLRQQQKPIISG